MEKNTTTDLETKQAVYDIVKGRFEILQKNRIVQQYLDTQAQLERATVELYAAKVNSAKTRVYSPSKKNTNNNSNK